jgi:hypothetical protein
MKNQEILHIERDSLHTCRVEILNHEGEFKETIGHTTLSKLKEAGYTTTFNTEAEIVELSLPHITDDTFKRGLKANYERLSKKEAQAKREKRQAANERYIAKQLEGMNLEDVMDKLGVMV